ncbi:protein of unknown function [Maridesulfovibrio hydrothermalis AM13 = DSM 14728]|uniref:Uncharacterized protein n=1 Tax=Maridesulfovibrio hydrothermalis AM13 = DSM 14728 TaxID=1121451 RepID=L0R8S2_9BACT|nr:protein of unknown function [Maridesulfovibrio hydrothermalis AM13 = DSM 14728]
MCSITIPIFQTKTSHVDAVGFPVIILKFCQHGATQKQQFFIFIALPKSII